MPAPLAVTRKFLLERMPTVGEIKAVVQTFEVFEVEQTYLVSLSSNERVRVRKRQQGSNVSFQHQLWISAAGDGGESKTSLMERSLTAREYFALVKQADPSRCAVQKTLTCFTYGNSYWELNSFRGAQDVCVLEVEAESVNATLSFPPMVAVKREVTAEASYDSYLIAQQLGKSVAEEQSSVRTPHRLRDVVERRMADVLQTLEREATSVSREASSSLNVSPSPSPTPVSPDAAAQSWPIK